MSRVLVIDDEPTFRRAMERVLGIDRVVLAAGDADSALTLLRQGNRFDAIVCDLRLPGASGVELYEQLEREWPDQADRTLFITGAASVDEVMMLRARGKWVLDKPCSAPAIRGALERVIREAGGADSTPTVPIRPPRGLTRQ